MSRRIRIASASLAVAGLLGIACAREASVRAPNLVVVTLDTTRADHTSVGDYERDTTPRLRRLAEEGVRFSAAYSTTASTAPAHASLFTSLLPREHGLDRNSLVLDPGVVTLAERLAARGFQTAGIPSSYVLDDTFGVAQGFQHYDDVFLPEEGMIRLRNADGAVQKGHLDRRADHTTDRAIAWLRARDPARPFFLFVHYMDPHAPYEPPPSYAERFGDDVVAKRAKTKLEREVVDRYDGEIVYTDQQLGRLVDELEAQGLARDTLVLVTADHGEGLQDHGIWLHTAQIYEEQVRVPLVIRWPGTIAPARTAPEPVSIIDVLPTLLDLLGLERGDEPLSGRSLAPFLRGEAALDAERPIHLHRRNYDKPEQVEGLRNVIGLQDGVRVGRWKWIEGDRDGTRMLFDLEADPGEKVNRSATDPERAAELSALVARSRAEQGPKYSEARALTREDIQKLRALGYAE